MESVHAGVDQDVLRPNELGLPKVPFDEKGFECSSIALWVPGFVCATMHAKGWAAALRNARCFGSDDFVGFVLFLAVAAQGRGA